MSNSGSSVSVCERSDVALIHSAVRLWLCLLGVVGLAMFSIIVALRSTVVSLVQTWMGDRSYQYGFLIIPIAIVLAWRRRHDLIKTRPLPCYWSLVPLCTAVLAWILGNIGDALEVQQFALVGMLSCSVWVILGTESARPLLFSLVFLIFAVPTGKSLVPPLQDFTGWFAALALRLSGIPVVLENHVLYVPTGAWQVAEACSGIRYLTTSIVMGVLFAGVAYRSWTRRLIFVLASIVVPILANGVRAYGIVLLGYLTDNRLAAGIDHLVYGWVFFSVVTLALLAVGARWHQAVATPPAASAPVVGPFPARLSYFVPPALIVVTLVIAGVSITSSLWARTPAEQASVNLIVPPSGWVTVGDGRKDWVPELTNLTTASTETFVLQAREVSVYIGYYAYGPRKFETIKPYNTVSASSGWRLLSSEARDVIAGDQRLNITQNKLWKGSQMRLVWFWYTAGTHSTSDPYRLKLVQAKQRLLGSPQNSAIVALSVPFDFDQSQAESILREFLQQSLRRGGPGSI